MANPVLIYWLVWGGVLFLYLLNATSNLVPINPMGVGLILLNMVSMLMLGTVLSLIYKDDQNRGEHYLKHYPSARIYFKFLFFLWVVGTVIEIYLQRGFPFLWFLVGDSRIYTDFGLPSFHGVMNALYLQSVTVLTFLYLSKPRKLVAFIIILLLFWPLMMFARGILLSALIQVAAVYFVMRRLGVRAILIAMIFSIVAVVLFGYVGDMRQVANPFSPLVRPTYIELFSSLPSGFLWFYVYLTSGLSNLFYNIEILEPSYSFSHTFYNLVPNAIKLWAGFSPRNDLFVLVDDGLNASTYYAAYISDFGLFGAFLTAVFVQAYCCVTYFLARTGRSWGVFSYAVSLQVLMFSIFYDLFFLLPTLMQFLLAFIYSRACLLFQRGNMA